MSNRGFKRTILKKKYEQFCRVWKDEQKFQQYLIDVQGAVVRDGMIFGPDGEKINVLGRKPTFAMWKTAMDNRSEQFEEQATQKGKVEVADTEW